MAVRFDGATAGRQKFAGRFSGGLVATAAVIPGIAAVVATILYVYRGSERDVSSISGTQAYILGTVGAISFWVILAFLFRARLTSVETANTAMYHELHERYDQTSSRLKNLRATGGAAAEFRSGLEEGGLIRARNNL